MDDTFGHQMARRQWQDVGLVQVCRTLTLHKQMLPVPRPTERRCRGLDSCPKRSAAIDPENHDTSAEPNASQLRSGDSPNRPTIRQVDGFPQLASVFLDTVKERRGPLDAAEKDFTGRAENGLFTFDVGNLPRRRAAVERREPQARLTTVVR